MISAKRSIAQKSDFSVLTIEKTKVRKERKKRTTRITRKIRVSRVIRRMRRIRRLLLEPAESWGSWAMISTKTSKTAETTMAKSNQFQAQLMEQKKWRGPNTANLITTSERNSRV